ncbi:serine hydrolase [Lysobacter niabensis]|uniref:serine hydrolase n=1 Tax=Agrilutibacter niabensis TaxID=380628 RepID=UPI00360A648D
MPTPASPRPIRRFGAFFLAACLSACAGAMPAAQAPEAPQSAQDAPRITAFRQQVEADRERLKIPGLSVVVLKDGRVLWTEGLGHADLEHKVPTTPDTLYHVASLTKTFTAILVWQLVEQGKLDLDEPASHYSSDFKDDSVRLKHLLSHTSGDTPGDHYKYNPDRFEYLKAVLEKKTGKPLRQLFVETFLDPLDMQDSVPGPDVADDPAKWAVLDQDHLARYRTNLARLAEPYTYYGDGEILHVSPPPADFWASAGLLSTVRDMAKYDAAVDHHALLKPETLARAWTPFLSNAGQPLAHGLGWFVTDYRGTRLVWHYGHWGTGFSALYLKVPAKHLSMILLSNSEALADHMFQIGEDITTNVFACDFLDTFVPELANASGQTSATAVADCNAGSRAALAKWIEDRRAKARKAITVAPALLQAYAGRYDVPDRGVWTVTAQGGHLYLVGSSGKRFELFAEAPNRFFLKVRPWTVTFVKEGARITRLDIYDSGLTLQAPRVE